MTVIAVEDDKVLRFLQILLDPATPLERMNVFADYVAHDIDQQQWLAAARAQVPAVFPASVRLLTNDADLTFVLKAASGTYYSIRTVVFYDTTAAADIQFGYNSNNANTAFLYAAAYGIAPGDTAFSTVVTQSIGNETNGIAVLGTGATGGMIVLDVLTDPNDINFDTKFTFTWAQKTQRTGETVTVKRGSYLFWQGTAQQTAIPL